MTVAPALNATFLASTLAGPVPLSVTFSATVTGGTDAAAAETHWSFGDGTGTTGASATATYSTVGEYVALATLSDSGHGNASEAFVIDAEAPSSSAIGVSGTVAPAVNVSSGETVHWAATAVGAPAALAGDVLAWSFGNGGGAFGPYANESFFSGVDLLADDQLDASLTLEGAGLTSLVHVPIELTGFFATEAGGFVPAVDALALSEEVFPAQGVVPLLVTGDAAATGPGAVGLAWLFGDGGSASGSPVGHVYYGAGAYTAQVEADDAYSDLAFRQDAVVANAALTLAGCGARTRQGTAPFTVVLAPVAGGGAGPPYTYRWTLPNGTLSTATNVTLEFPNPGTYTVAVVVTDASGATYGCAWSIVVVTVPPVSFLEILVGGTVAGVALAGVFLWATRPRRDRGGGPPPTL